MFEQRKQNKTDTIRYPFRCGKGEQFRYPTYLLDFDFNIVYNKLNFFARKTTSIIHYSSAVGDFIFHYKNPFLMNDEY